MTVFRLTAMLGFVAALGGLLAACATPVPEPAYPPISYAHLGKISLNVGRIEVVQAGPKKARCKIVAEQDTVRKGDRITSKL